MTKAKIKIFEGVVISRKSLKTNISTELAIVNSNGIPVLTHCKREPEFLFNDTNGKNIGLGFQVYVKFQK